MLCHHSLNNSGGIIWTFSPTSASAEATINRICDVGGMPGDNGKPATNLVGSPLYNNGRMFVPAALWGSGQCTSNSRNANIACGGIISCKLMLLHLYTSLLCCCLLWSSADVVWLDSFVDMVRVCHSCCFHQQWQLPADIIFCRHGCCNSK